MINDPNIDPENKKTDRESKHRRSLSFGKQTHSGQDYPPSQPEENAWVEEIPWVSLDESAVADVSPGDETHPGNSDEVEPQNNSENNTPEPKNVWQSLDEVSPQEEDLVSILQVRNQSEQRIRKGLPVEAAPEKPLSIPSDSGIGDTSPVSSESREKVSAGWIDVADVTFYLAPRQDDHYLLGEIPHMLRRWLPALCEVYGWQLGFIAVRPDYMKWTLRDFPESLNRKMLSIIRRETSKRIFSVFPHLQGGDATGDYWAPGYLVDTQNKEYSTRALMAYVFKSRVKVE